jgi:hypothetical protein
MQVTASSDQSPLQAFIVVFALFTFLEAAPDTSASRLLLLVAAASEPFRSGTPPISSKIDHVQGEPPMPSRFILPASLPSSCVDISLSRYRIAKHLA